MTDTDASPVDPVVGTAVDDAVEAVLDREYRAELGEVRAALDTVAEDGTVTRSGIGAAVDDAAEHVASAEDSFETAGDELDSAREAVSPVNDFGAVRSRLGPLTARYESVEEAVTNLTDRLDSLDERGRQPKDVHDLANSIRDLKESVPPVYERVEQFRQDAEAFETWARDPSVRYDELDADADYVENVLDELDTAADNIESGEIDTDRDVAEAWAEAVLQRRVADLLLADLRAELSDLRDWPADASGGRGDETRVSEIEARLDDLRARESELAQRLDGLARPAWRERFADRLDAFEDDLEAFDPPVPWGPVLKTFSDHQSALGDAA